MRRAIHEGVEIGGQRLALPLQNLQSIDDPRDLRLYLDHSLLQTLAGGIARLCETFIVLEQGPFFLVDLDRGVDVTEFVEGPF